MIIIRDKSTEGHIMNQSLKIKSKNPERGFQLISEDTHIGDNVYLANFINLYGCVIGDNCKVGSFTEIQRGVKIGAKTKVCTNTLICSGVVIGSGCFIGNGTVFINDNQPRALSVEGKLEVFEDWKDRFCETIIEDNVSIGSNCTIIGGIRIGKGARIGAGSVVTKDVPAGDLWVGNPALPMRYRKGILGLIKGLIYRFSDLF